MQSNFRLVSALMRGLWFIEESYADTQQDLIDRMLAGDGLSFARGDVQRENAEAAEDEMSVFAIAPGGGTFRASRYRSYNDAPQGAVAVIPLQGVVMRDDYCGDIGTDSRIQLVNQAAAHPNISAVVIDVNSPGGEASGLATFWDAIAAANRIKPVLGFVNDGMSASAGYFPISACAEVYVSHDHCGVGSIGCVLFMRDTRERQKKEGDRSFAVYAPQSTEKNKDFQDALDGKPEALKEGMLRAWCGDFISRVQLGRGDRLNPEAGNPFTGKMYWSADESKAMGLIDGVKTFQETIERAFELSQNWGSEQELIAGAPGAAAGALPAPAASPTTNSSLTTTKMHTRLLSLLGLTMALEATKDGTHLQAAHLDAIEGALEARETAEAALATATTNLAARDQSILDLTARAETAEQELAARQKPAAETTAPKLQGDDRTAPPKEQPAVDAQLEAVLKAKEELGIPNK